MYVILAVVYLIVGFIVAIPYCLLAGWDSYNYPAVAILAPGMAFLWFMCGALSGHFHNYGKRVVNFSWWNRNDPLKFGWVFYGWSLYCLLPILVHWGSKLMDVLGYEEVAATVDAHRYISPIYAIFVFVGLLVMCGMVVALINGTKRGWNRVSHAFHR